MTASTMLMMEVEEYNTDHNKVTVPGSLAGGTRGLHNTPGETG